MASRHVLAALILASMGACAACSSSSSHHELDPYLCAQQDVGDNYQQLIEGDVSPNDLADLGSNPASRARAFRDAGLERGRFALFKQALPKPPFDPQVNVVCQVLEFKNSAQATAFLKSLDPDPSSLSAVTSSSLSLEGATAVESPIGDAHDPPWTPEQLGRSFDISASNETGQTHIRALVFLQDRFVLSIVAGGPGVSASVAADIVPGLRSCLEARLASAVCPSR
ncbi:MAG: hypothetical protein ABI577_09455 [bacterium]